MKVILIVISVIAFYPLFSQDTIEIKDREVFNDISWKLFMDMKGSNIDPADKVSIDSIFRTYNFDDTVYLCQYFLMFSFDLDSCGSIVKFKPIHGHKNYGDEIKEFQSDIENWFLKESKPIPNYCLVENKSHFQFWGELFLEISCEPSEILYWEDKTSIDRGTVFMHRTENGPIYFSGYKFFCNEQ